MEIKKIRPSLGKPEGYNAFFCEKCVTEWLQKGDATEMECPDCDKKMRKTFDANPEERP